MNGTHPLSDPAASISSLSQLPPAWNEPVRSYAPGTPERSALTAAIQRLSGERPDLPLFIGGREVRTGNLRLAVMPHRHAHVLADVHQAGPGEVADAIAAARAAAPSWAALRWEERAAVFLRAADLLCGPWRATINAATMLNQSKTIHQAEIDSAVELADFWRFNVTFMARIYAEQPLSPAASGSWNRIDYRPLEGFVLALTPFNFTAIAGNLPTAPALMGNTVVWKPAATAALSAHLVMEILRQAGLPDGVINLVHGDGAEVARIALDHEDLAGVHFTGSTAVFDHIQKGIGERMGRYRAYPRVVGETGGKNFILAHPSADIDSLATAIIRGAFEYQGQKCSAASRLFLPASLWPALRERLSDEISTIRMGDVSDLRTFMGAVIDERAWQRHTDAIAEFRRGSGQILAGGTCDRTTGYFVSPTLLKTDDLGARVMRDELFGPITAAYVYADTGYAEMADLIDRESRYALTGSIFANDRTVIADSLARLRHAAGNIYINDKPTGAVVGQQPFGGARASGTNDKAGSIWNLMRWVSPRTIKETFVPPVGYRYPSMADPAS